LINTNPTKNQGWPLLFVLSNYISSRI
jgi:hypothetical protein